METTGLTHSTNGLVSSERQQVLQPSGPGRGIFDLDVPDAADAGLDALEVLVGGFLGQLDLDAEHQLLSLALRLDLLGRELRFGRHEADVAGDRAFRVVVDGDPAFGADLHAGRLIRGKEDLHVDVFHVHQRERFSAGGEDLAGFGQAIQDSSGDGGLERRVVDARLDGRRVGPCDFDLLLGGLQHRFRFLEGGLGGFQLRPADVQLSLRPGAFVDESFRALDLDLGELDLALLFGDGSVRHRQAFLRGRNGRIGLFQLCLQRDGVQLHQDLTWRDESAFVDEDLFDPEGFLGGHIDELCLDPAVARYDPFR